MNDTGRARFIPQTKKSRFEPAGPYAHLRPYEDRFLRSPVSFNLFYPKASESSMHPGISLPVPPRLVSAPEQSGLR